MSNININKSIGKVTYNGNEVPIKGEEDLTLELNTQDGLLTNLETEINGLPEAGGGSDEEVVALKSKLKSIINGTITELTEEDFEGIIEIRQYTFQGCTNLTAVTMPEGITTIGFAAFYGCTKLERVEIPSTVTMINSRAFLHGATGLVIRIKAQTPPTITARNSSNGSFKYSGSFTIEVPQGTLDAYLSDGNWNTYDVEAGGSATFIEYEVNQNSYEKD